MKLTLLTLVNNKNIYKENVLASTIKENNEGNVEYIVINNPPYATEGINRGIEKSTNNTIIYCHQDIYFLEGWYNKLLYCFNLLNIYKKNWGVCGFAGTKTEGKMVGTHSGLGMDNCDVREVQTLDCSTLIIRKSINQKYDLKFDENLKYFHGYGEDFSLQCINKGLNVCVLNVNIQHNCRWTAGEGIGETFQYIKQKWKHKFKTIYTTVGTY